MADFPMCTANEVLTFAVFALHVAVVFLLASACIVGTTLVALNVLSRRLRAIRMELGTDSNESPAADTEGLGQMNKNGSGR